MEIAIINGPNLNLQGLRQQEVYGNVSFDAFFDALKREYPQVSFSFYQSNIEGELIGFLHQKGFSCEGIVLNAGGYTHTSVAIFDAIHAIAAPVVEVHISNVFARESFRRESLLAAACIGSISGFGLDSYRLAVEALILKTTKSN